MKNKGTPGKNELDQRICHRYDTLEGGFNGNWLEELIKETHPPQIDSGHYDYYFNSYSHYSIHEDMLKDSVRTESYKTAIDLNSSVFANKVVLDIGCGTGILSIFAAKAGAKKVYGVDNADIIEAAKQIIKINNFEDKIVLIHKQIEDVDEFDIPEGEVDIIISEWMGYFLLYESMLDSILNARDKWLKKGGLILPSKVRLNIAAIEDGQYKKEKYEFWNNIYGIDMKNIKYMALREPLVDYASKDLIVSTSYTILELNIATIDTRDYKTFAHTYRLNILAETQIDALVAWFDVFFELPSYVMFSTSPFSKETHWKQTVFYLNHPIKAVKGSVLHGTIAVKQGSINYRDLDIGISFIYSENGVDKLSKKKLFKLS